MADQEQGSDARLTDEQRAAIERQAADYEQTMKAEDILVDNQPDDGPG